MPPTLTAMFFLPLRAPTTSPRDVAISLHQAEPTHIYFLPDFFSFYDSLAVEAFELVLCDLSKLPKQPLPLGFLFSQE